MIRTRLATALVAAAATLAAAAPARAEKLIFGLTQAKAGETLFCAGESSQALGAYLLFETGKPMTETLQLAKQSAAGQAAPAEAERRIREVYLAKPRTAVEWGRRSFQGCLASRQVPLPADRIGNCYMLTFYLASVVPVHKANGHTPKTMMDLILTPQADPTFRSKVEPLVAEFYARDTTDPRKNSVADLGRFLQCAAPGKAPVSGG